MRNESKLDRVKKKMTREAVQAENIQETIKESKESGTERSGTAGKYYMRP